MGVRGWDLNVLSGCCRLFKADWMVNCEGQGGRDGDLSRLSQSDLLLERFLRSPGGGGSSGSPDRLIGHDTRGELLLGLLEAGVGGAVQRMDLRGRR